jgi:hypothetical protein
MNKHDLRKANESLDGYVTKVKIGSWSKARPLKVDMVSIAVRITAGCFDCETCQERVQIITQRLVAKKAEYMWRWGGWLIVPNNLGNPFERLSELLEEKVKEVVVVNDKMKGEKMIEISPNRKTRARR